MSKLEPGFPLSVDLGPNGGEKQFSSFAELETWLNVEQGTWEWTKSRGGSLASSQWTPIENVLRTVAEYRRDPDSRALLATNIAKQLKISFGRSNYFHSSRPEAKLITSLNARSEGAAAVALSHLTSAGSYPSANAIETALGIASAVLFQNGLSSDAMAAQREALAEVFKAGQAQAETARREHAAWSEAAERTRSVFVDEAGADLTRMRAEADAAREEIARASAALQELVEQGKAHRDDAMKAFTDNIAHRAPVHYWMERQRVYRDRSIRFAVACAATAVVVGGAAWSALSAVAERPLAAQIGPALLVLVIVAWVLGLLGRSLLSSLHLEDDAGERVAMTQTYLALQEGGRLLEDDATRSAILAALFSPSRGDLIKSSS